MKSVLALALGSLFAVSTAWAEAPAPLVPSGDTVLESMVGDRAVTSENSQKSSEEVRIQYPNMSRDILSLYMIDKVVWTSNGTLDLYAGETLWLILERLQGAEMFTVRQSLYTFEPMSVEHTFSSQFPDKISSLDFLFKGCSTVQGQAQVCDTVRTHLGLTDIVPQ